MLGAEADVQHVAILDGEGVLLVDREPRRGLYGLQVAFIHPDAVHGVLTELVTSA